MRLVSARHGLQGFAFFTSQVDNAFALISRSTSAHTLRVRPLCGVVKRNTYGIGGRKDASAT